VAQKVNVVLVDDLDGSQAEESVSFSLDGVSYEIDLSGKNAQKLRNAFGPYVDAARRVGGRAARGRGRTARPSGSGSGGASGSRGGNKAETAEIRAWAKSEGYDVSSRGRIPSDIIEAYQKAKR